MGGRLAVALILCPDCSRKVSDEAVACPGCARPIAALDGGGRAQGGRGAERRARQPAPLVQPAPPPSAPADAHGPQDAERHPAPTFSVPCRICKAETVLLYPRSGTAYVCPDCEEQSMLRAWSWQVALRWLPVVLGLVVLVGVVWILVSNIDTGRHGPHGD